MQYLFRSYLIMEDNLVGINNSKVRLFLCLSVNMILKRSV